MRKLAPFIIALTLNTASAQTSVNPATSGNPIFPGWYADPEAAIFDNTYWVYPTFSDKYDNQVFFDAFSSPDLIHWTKHPHILDTASIRWAHRAMWAPAITKNNGKYYFFFGANDIQNDSSVGGIGVAVADKPEGPYKDYLGKPLVGEFHNGAQPIDQAVFQDKDGQYYLIYGGWGGPDYSVAYAMADAPTGPFQRIGKILQQDTAVATGAGHHSVIHIPGTDDYYIVYHRRPLGETDANHRVTCIDKMVFSPGGLIQPVIITKQGVPPRPLIP